MSYQIYCDICGYCVRGDNELDADRLLEEHKEEKHGVQNENTRAVRI